MNRNILVSSLLIAGFFMFLSFILRMLFFTNYISLIQQPLIIFITWFGMMVLVFYFLKNDFPEIYKQLVLFTEDTPETETEAEVETEGKNENLTLLDEDDTDYSDVFNHPQSSNNREDDLLSSGFSPGPINKMMDSESVLAQEAQASKDTSEYQDAFAKQDPKKLAGLVKNYLKQE